MHFCSGDISDGYLILCNDFDQIPYMYETSNESKCGSFTALQVRPSSELVCGYMCVCIDVFKVVERF